MLVGEHFCFDEADSVQNGILYTGIHNVLLLVHVFDRARQSIEFKEKSTNSFHLELNVNLNTPSGMLFYLQTYPL